METWEPAPIRGSTAAHLFDGLEEAAADRQDASWRPSGADSMRTRPHAKVISLPRDEENPLVRQGIYLWAHLDLNQGPHPYQGCALTGLSYGPSRPPIRCVIAVALMLRSSHSASAVAAGDYTL